MEAQKDKSNSIIGKQIQIKNIRIEGQGTPQRRQRGPTMKIHLSSKHKKRFSAMRRQSEGSKDDSSYMIGEGRVSARYNQNHNIKSINGDLPLGEEIESPRNNFQNQTLIQVVNATINPNSNAIKRLDESTIQKQNMSQQPQTQQIRGGQANLKIKRPLQTNLFSESTSNQVNQTSFIFKADQMDYQKGDASTFSPMQKRRNLQVSTTLYPRLVMSQQQSPKIIEQVKKENEQLKDLNRKLVDELEIYRYKDSLKEAEKYYAEEHEQMQEMISDMIDQLRFSTQEKEELEKNFEFVVDDSIEQIKTHIDKFNEEYALRLKLEKELNDKTESYINMEARLDQLTKEKTKLDQDYEDLKKHYFEVCKKVQRYQRIYHDVDISQIHEKITLLNTENDYYKNLSQKLQSMNVNLRMKAKTLLIKQKDSGLVSQNSKSKNDDYEFDNDQSPTLVKDVMRKEQQAIQEEEDEDLDKDEMQKQVVRPDFESELEKSGFSLMTRF